MQTEAQWTKPHHGVQHLKPVARGFQFTVTARGDDMAEALVLRPGSGCQFSTVEKFDGPGAVANARTWAERRMRELGAEVSR
jgi:hypothetical protein